MPLMSPPKLSFPRSGKPFLSWCLTSSRLRMSALLRVLRMCRREELPVRSLLDEALVVVMKRPHSYTGKMSLRCSATVVLWCSTSSVDGCLLPEPGLQSQGNLPNAHFSTVSLDLAKPRLCLIPSAPRRRAA